MYTARGKISRSLIARARRPICAMASSRPTVNRDLGRYMMLPAFCLSGLFGRNLASNGLPFCEKLPPGVPVGTFARDGPDGGLARDAAGVGRGTATRFRPQSGFQSSGEACQAPSVNPSFPCMPRGPVSRGATLPGPPPRRFRPPDDKAVGSAGSERRAAEVERI